jgi:fatty acid desaturase
MSPLGLLTIVGCTDVVGGCWWCWWCWVVLGGVGGGVVIVHRRCHTSPASKIGKMKKRLYD